jgi:hypothetical protein
LEFIAKTKQKKSFSTPTQVTETPNEMDFSRKNSLKIFFVSKNQQDMPTELHKMFSHKIFMLEEIYCENEYIVIVHKETKSDVLTEKRLFLLCLKLRLLTLPRKESEMQI